MKTWKVQSEEKPRVHELRTIRNAFRNLTLAVEYVCQTDDGIGTSMTLKTFCFLVRRCAVAESPLVIGFKKDSVASHCPHVKELLPRLYEDDR